MRVVNARKVQRAAEEFLEFFETLVSSAALGTPVTVTKKSVSAFGTGQSDHKPMGESRPW